MMISKSYCSGMDCCVEVVVEYREVEIVVNIQGDELFIDLN